MTETMQDEVKTMQEPPVERENDKTRPTEWAERELAILESPDKLMPKMYSFCEVQSLLIAKDAEWKQRIKNGEVCLSCGEPKDSPLADWCHKCFDEN